MTPEVALSDRLRHFFIEMKAPGKKPERHQLHEHEIMRTIGGCDVRVIDSAEAVEEFIRDVCP